MIPRRMQRIVSDDPALAALWERTRALRELQKLFASCVPPYLRTVTRVGAVAGDELKLFADSGAAATRLRLLAPGLLAEFRSKGWEFSAIRVSVQVRTMPVPPRQAPRRSPDPGARRSLQRLAEALPESPLQAAISRLAKLK